MQIAVYQRIASVLPNVQPRVIEKEEQARQAEAEAAQKSAGITEESKNKKRAPIEKTESFGRNDLVTIENGEETKELKYKKAEPLIASGEWTLKK